MREKQDSVTAIARKTDTQNEQDRNRTSKIQGQDLQS